MFHRIKTGKFLICALQKELMFLLMDVTRLADSTIEKRLELCGKVKEYLPSCKTALLCDEQAYPDLADMVKQAKQFGKISSFFYSSVTADYLAAALDAL